MANEVRLGNSSRKAKLGLDGVDLSYRNLTSAPLGMLVPTMVQEVVGKSKVRIGLESQTRCRPLVVPSFVRLREHFDYFFVPFSQLWHQYDNFKSAQSNYNSALMDNAMSGNMPNTIPCIEPTYMYNAVINAQTDSIEDVAGFDLSQGMLRLMDNLGYGVINNGSGITDKMANYLLPVNAFRALAYQKIYYDYYRNDKYEANIVPAYNIDDVLNNSLFNDNTRIQQIFEPHYRWRKKDYFTSVWPNDLPNTNLFGFEGLPSSFYFGAGSSVSAFRTNGIPNAPSSIYSSNGTYVSALGTGNSVDNDGDITGLTQSNIADSVRLTSPVSGTASIQSMNSHRLMAAQERYLRKLYAAKQNFPSIMQSIFGYSPNIGRNGSVMHLGGRCNRISVSDVNNNTDLTNLPAGKINNYSSSDKVVNSFEVPEDGIIMCIYSTSIENDYRCNQLSRHNVKRFPEEYFNPNYTNLGRQPLFRFEYNCGTDSSKLEETEFTNVIGYIERYLEYKTHPDEVHGALSTNQFSPYAAYINEGLESTDSLSITSLITNPQILINVFSGGAYDGTTMSDHFQLNIYNKVDCLTPIKVLEPYE